MGDKHEIGAVLFFKVSSNQVFFLWLQIVWVFDLGSISFGGKAFCLGKGHCRDLLYFRKFDFKDFQLRGIFLL